MACHAFLDLIAAARSAFVLVVAGVPDLSVLGALQALVHFRNPAVRNAWLTAVDIVMCFCCDAEAIWWLHVAVRLQEGHERRVGPAVVRLVAWSVQTPEPIPSTTHRHLHSLDESGA